jgi:hypothetical protein
MIDFTQQVFTGYYVQNGAKYCYTVYPEFSYCAGDGALHYKDKVNVIAITPYAGTICFTLQYIKGEWMKIIPVPFVKSRLLKKINTKIKKVTDESPLIRTTVNKIK